MGSFIILNYLNAVLGKVSLLTIFKSHKFYSLAGESLCSDLEVSAFVEVNALMLTFQVIAC